MATPKPSYDSASAQATALAVLCNGGTLVLYSGTQPATPETALSGNTALATFSFSATAGTVSNGVITFSLAAGTVTIANSGTATWFRAYKSDGTTAVFDGTVGTSGAVINLNSVALSSGATLTLSGVTYTVPGY